MLSSETVIISGVDDWTNAVGSVSVGGVANNDYFQNVSLCLCVCFSSECGGRRTRGRMEKDEKVESGHTL